MRNQPMQIIPNETYQPLFENKKVRYFILMGGRANGRSYTASQYVLLKTLTEDYSRIAIMRFVLTDIRNSIYQEIIDRIEENELEPNFKTNTNPLGIENLDNKNKIVGIGFRKSSSDQKAKLKSLANFTSVVIEEADETPEEDFMQLDDSLRSKKGDITIILCLNAPSKNHWIIKRWFNLIPSGVEGYYKPELKESATDVCYIHGTYQGNKENLAEKTIANYEKYKTTKPDHYWNMIMGYVSEGARGRIFKDWKTLSNAEYDELPYTEEFGLDFGFSCLTGDTEVQTDSGVKNLEDIKVGDMVQTRKGFNKVTHAVGRGLEDVYRVDFGYGRSIIATPDHRIFTQDGWKRVDELSDNENLCIQKKSFTMVKSTKDTYEENTLTTSSQPKGIEKNFIEKYTKIITEIFLKALMYTMLTSILSITLLKTLWRYLSQTIIKLTTNLIKVDYRSSLKKKWRNIEQYMGIQKRTGKREEKSVWLQLMQKLKNVLNVEKVLYRLTHIKSIVVQYAERELIQEITRKSIPVKIVEWFSCHQLIIQEHLVQENVPIYSERLQGQRKVYDISVRGESEFFANGVLVHNCDPTALVGVKKHNNKVYLREYIYETGLTNQMLANRMELLGIYKGAVIYADSAEPKSIAELQTAGFNVLPATKGPDSIRAGIDMLLSKDVFYTEESTNIALESQEYKWAVDRDKNPTNKPVDSNNHIVDSVRYCVFTSANQPFVGVA